MTVKVQKKKKNTVTSVKKRVLFLCTGNTCRSPMAEMIFNSLAKAKGGIINYRATSAGICVLCGDKINPLACRALDSMSIKVRAGFHSRQLTVKTLEGASFVYCMSGSIVDYIRAKYPDCAIKTRLFGEGVPDPYGMNEQMYIDIAKIIRINCIKIIDEI